MDLFDSCVQNILGNPPMAQPNNSSLDLTITGNTQVGAAQASFATTATSTTTAAHSSPATTA
jgi:hypothetical protein